MTASAACVDYLTSAGLLLYSCDSVVSLRAMLALGIVPCCEPELAPVVYVALRFLNCAERMSALMSCCPTTDGDAAVVSLSSAVWEDDWPVASWIVDDVSVWSA